MSMLNKKYIIWPGVIANPINGQPHHVTAMALMRMARVSAAECIIAPEPGGPPWVQRQRDQLAANTKLIHIKPQFEDSEVSNVKFN